jgi:hypothetical protein
MLFGVIRDGVGPPDLQIPYGLFATAQEHRRRLLPPLMWRKPADETI